MSTTRVPAIRVACQGEAPQTIKEYEIYSLLPDHDVFKHGEPSPISLLVNCELRILKLRPSLLDKPTSQSGRQYSNKIDGPFHPNPVAAALMVEVPAMAPSTAWESRVGSVLIARADKKPLHVLHLSILIGFAELAARMHREEGMAFDFMLTPYNFRMYYPKALQYMATKRHDVASVPSLLNDDEEAKEVETRCEDGVRSTE